MDCSPKCRKAKHSDLNFSAVLNIGQEDAAKVQSILPQLCANFARVTDQYGRNALHLAASCGKCDILEWLVKEQGADLNSKDEESGWTSLHRSLFYGYLDCAVKLIQLGSELSCFDKEGLCPLDLVQLDSPFQISSGVQGKVVSSYKTSFIYKTSLEDELKLSIGDTVRDIEMTGDKYWTGNLNGKRGYFPKDSVQLLMKDYPLELFTWGSNTNFTLGHRDESTRYTPEIVECGDRDAKLFIKEVVMCKFHSVFLSTDGRIFTCGHGRGGRLGHGNEETLLEPQEVTALKDVKYVSIAAGQDHTIVVTKDGLVYTFGLNYSQQLGHSPAPKECLLPKLVQVKSWKGKAIVGAGAGRYHSVFFTRNEVYSCGLNAGQLGHIKGEQYQTLPRQVSGLAGKNVVISKVTCSDGATVCATVKGDIFLLNLYTCRRIISRFNDLTNLAVVGGKLDMVSPQNIGNKFGDELAVTLLNSRGMVFQWKPDFSSPRECHWYYNRPITVRDFAVGKQFLVLSDHGEAFICLSNQSKSSPIKADSKKRNRSSSITSKTTESTLAHSPPMPSPLGNIGKEKDDPLVSSNSTPLSLLDEESKKVVVGYYLERIPFIHRGLRIFTDSKSRGFAALQIAANEGLKKVPCVSPAQVGQHLIQLLEETTREDDMHDVEFLVKGQVIPAHGFVLASRSPKCHQLICEIKENWPQIPDKRMRTIPLHENVDYAMVMSWLRRLYSGEGITDKEVFLKDVPVKGKNGFHSISKNKNKTKITIETDETVNKKKLEPEHNEEDMISDRALADLVYLAERDLDDFSSPTFDDDEDFPPKNGDELAKRDILQAAEMNETKTSQTKTSDRKDEEDHVCSGRELMTFSRTNCPELYDVVIVSEDGTELQCHKCILVARLEYFRSMWACCWLEASSYSKTVKLPFPTVILELILDFLYSGQAGKLEEITDLELLGQILIVADQLLICRMREICEAVIANLVTLKNVNEILEFSLLYNANQLRDVCTEFITNNLASLMEARALDSLSDEALTETSKAYRSLVSRMAWRVITPSDVHDSILNESTESSQGKRRKSSGRKKSSKSESEHEIGSPGNVQENSPKEVESSNIKENEDVFSQQESSERESPPIDMDDENGSTETVEQAAQEHDGAEAQTLNAGGLWYRKNTPAVIKPNKRMRDKKQTAGKSADTTEEKHTPQMEETAAEKVSSPEKPAWSSKTSIPSPPATSLKDIIEQEQSQALFDVNSVNEVDGRDKCLVSPSKATCNKLSPDQRVGTSPRWSSGGRISQKQRKRSKSNTPDQSGEDKVADAASTEKEEKPQPAWGGVTKGPAPVTSLRDLMQEEEQRQSGKKQEIVGLSPAFTSKSPVALGKSGSSRKKLNWRLQPDLNGSASDVDAQEIVETDCEHLSGIPLSPPKSAWQSPPMACSLPAPSIAFSTILESQEQENSNLNKASKKPFHLTQLEERAMEELMQYYGGKDNACEFVTVERIPSTAARPVWKKERSPSVTSN